MEPSLSGAPRDARRTTARAAHPGRPSGPTTALLDDLVGLLDDLASLIDRSDRPDCLARLHLAGRACADPGVGNATRRHLARRTDTLVTAIRDAMFARCYLVARVAGWADAAVELSTLRADAAAARDRLAASLDAFHGDETITAAIRTSSE